VVSPTDPHGCIRGFIDRMSMHIVGNCLEVRFSQIQSRADERGLTITFQCVPPYLDIQTKCSEGILSLAEV
jgi:hypothetical protein